MPALEEAGLNFLSFASAGPNYATGNARAGVAGRLGLVIVGSGVDDEAAADDARRPGRNGNDVDIGLDLGPAALVRLERRQVAGMTVRAAVMAVRLAVRIEVPLGAH